MLYVIYNLMSKKQYVIYVMLYATWYELMDTMLFL
jgi:hypothetical protein